MPFELDLELGISDIIFDLHDFFFLMALGVWDQVSTNFTAVQALGKVFLSSAHWLIQGKIPQVQWPQ